MKSHSVSAHHMKSLDLLLMEFILFLVPLASSLCCLLCHYVLELLFVFPVREEESTFYVFSDEIHLHTPDNILCSKLLLRDVPTPCIYSHSVFLSFVLFLFSYSIMQVYHKCCGFKMYSVTHQMINVKFIMVTDCILIAIINTVIQQV